MWKRHISAGNSVPYEHRWIQLRRKRTITIEVNTLEENTPHMFHSISDSRIEILHKQMEYFYCLFRKWLNELARSTFESLQRNKILTLSAALLMPQGYKSVMLLSEECFNNGFALQAIMNTDNIENIISFTLIPWTNPSVQTAMLRWLRTFCFATFPRQSRSVWWSKNFYYNNWIHIIFIYSIFSINFTRSRISRFDVSCISPANMNSSRMLYTLLKLKTISSSQTLEK